MARAEAGMGIDAGDVDGDGDLDLVLSHLLGETHTLYLREEVGFRDATVPAGIAAPTLPLTGFGIGFLDVDLDRASLGKTVEFRRHAFFLERHHARQRHEATVIRIDVEVDEVRWVVDIAAGRFQQDRDRLVHEGRVGETLPDHCVRGSTPGLRVRPTPGLLGDLEPGVPDARPTRTQVPGPRPKVRLVHPVDVVRRPHIWRERGETARRRAERHYSWDYKISAALGVYLGLRRRRTAPGFVRLSRA